MQNRSRQSVEDINRSIQESRDRMAKNTKKASVSKSLLRKNKKMVAVAIIVVVLLLAWCVKPIVEVAMQQKSGYSTERALEWIPE